MRIAQTIAMQKVVGSSPITRLREARSWRGFSFLKIPKALHRNFPRPGRSEPARLIREHDVLDRFAHAQRFSRDLAPLGITAGRMEDLRQYHEALRVFIRGVRVLRARHCVSCFLLGERAVTAGKREA